MEKIDSGINSYNHTVTMIERKSFVTDTVTDYYPSISENEKLQYKKAEKVHEQC